MGEKAPEKCKKRKWPFADFSSNTAFTTNRRRQNMDPSFLATLTMIGVNKKAYTPTVADIKDMYFKLFCNKGGEAGPQTPKKAAGGAGSSTNPM